jgi:1,4-alpha-glucan branching enzyme
MEFYFRVSSEILITVSFIVISGYDADYEYIKPYIAKNGARVNTGIKYHRITSKGEFKDYYDVRWAMDSAEKHAGHFFDSRINQIDFLSSNMDIPPVILCPYDAELYGHWWYEGPYWIYILFKKIYHDHPNFRLTTPSEYIDKYPEMQVSAPCISSWGANRI